MRVFLALSFFFAIAAQAAPTSIEMVSQIDKLYAPNGFDSNDVVEIVIAGHFPSSCYKLGQTLTHVDPQAKTITITPMSYKEYDVACVQMISPYAQVVKLGKLNEGDYTFKVTDNPHVNKSVRVKRAQINTDDDYLYPPVEYAEVINSAQGNPVLIFKGRYPLMKRGCMKTDQALIELQNNEILVVQPISTVSLFPEREDEDGCRTSYEKKVQLPNDVHGDVLVHVRSINGQSYNRVVTIQ